MKYHIEFTHPVLGRQYMSPGYFRAIVEALGYIPAFTIVMEQPQ